MSEHGAVQLTRRSLVTSAGAAGAAIALAHVPSASAARPTRVGVLVPTGLSHARAGDSLLAGLRLGALRSGLRLDVRTEPVERGYVDAAAATGQLLEKGAQVVVAGVSGLAARGVAPVCAEAGVGLVVANVGAHVVAERQGAVHTSLQLWQASLTAGQWSARHLGRRMFVVVAAPDAGYDSVYAVQRGFTGAGGIVVGQALTHGARRGTRAAAQEAKASGAGVVAVCASGRRVGEIVRALRAAGVRADIVVDAVALEDFSLRHLGRAGQGVYGAASWTARDRSRRNADFVRDYRESVGRRPDAFSVLGHDTGALLAAGAERLARRGRDWSRLSSTLAGTAVPGARGVQRVHPTLGTVSTPLSLHKVVRRDGRLTPGAVARRDRVGGVAPAVKVLARHDAAAYTNEYLGS